MTLASQAETSPSSPHLATRPAVEARTVLISVNPRAGSRYRRDHIGSIAAQLSRAGYEVQTTSDLAELSNVSTAAHQQGILRTVLAIGGDGTASVVRNHVPLTVPILAVPMGTENLLGRYTRQAANPSAVVEAVDKGVVIRLDLGRANGRYFLLLMSAGFDAEAVRSLHLNRRGNIRRLAYVVPFLRAARHYRFPEMELYWHDNQMPGDRPVRCRWLFGFNFPLYALGLPIAPDAVATDGLFDLCAFERGSVWSILRYSWHVIRRGHLSLSDTRLVRAPRFRLSAVDSTSIAYQLDGDHGGELPVDVELCPGDLRMLVSPETAVRLGFVLSNERPYG